MLRPGVVIMLRVRGDRAGGHDRRAGVNSNTGALECFHIRGPLLSNQST